MQRTHVAAERHLHRFDPTDIGELVDTMWWCACGEQHPVKQVFHTCTRCPFTIGMTVQGGHSG